MPAKTIDRTIYRDITRQAMRTCALFIAIYTVLIFLLPANKKVMANYNFSDFQYHLVVLTTALPTMAVWIAGFYGAAQLQIYGKLLGKAKEARDFNRLALGSKWLVLSLPIPTLIANIVNGIANMHGSFHATAIIISNYAALVFPLIAFVIIAGAARGMVVNAKVKFNIWSARLLLLLFTIAGAIYCIFIFNRFPDHQLGSSDNPYFLPIWLMVLTVIVPYLFTWFLGLRAAYEINTYSRSANGLLYKQALRMLAFGLIAVIASSIAIQYANTVQPRVGYLDFNLRFFMVILFRLIGGAGFILLALGAKRLRRIEEV